MSGDHNMNQKKSIDVELVRENEDGSAVYMFDFTIEQQEALLRLGIMTAIKLGIEEAKQFHPDYNEESQHNDSSNQMDV